MQYKLPVRFYDDRLERELYHGIEIKRTKAYVILDLSQDDIEDIKSDAEYYSKDVEDAPVGIKISAKDTYKILSGV